MESLRKEWFKWVAKTRKKMQRGNKETVAHRDAMKAASVGWAAEKAKILRRQKREAKKNAR